jgi:hypothetical protein
MAALGNSLAERISRWDTLISNAEPVIGELSHITAELATLKQMFEDARDLQHRQDDLRSQAREINTVLLGLALRGDRLRSRLGAALQSKYGFTSDMLRKFGFKPRRPPRRRPAETPEAPTAPPDAPKASAPEDPQ